MRSLQDITDQNVTDNNQKYKEAIILLNELQLRANNRARGNVKFLEELPNRQYKTMSEDRGDSKALEKYYETFATVGDRCPECKRCTWRLLYKEDEELIQEIDNLNSADVEEKLHTIFRTQHRHYPWWNIAKAYGRGEFTLYGKPQ